MLSSPCRIRQLRAFDLAHICSSAQSDMTSEHVDPTLTDAKTDLSLQCQAWQHAKLGVKDLVLHLVSIQFLRFTYCEHQSQMFKAVCCAGSKSSKG